MREYKWRYPKEWSTRAEVEQMGAEFLAQARDEGFDMLELRIWENSGWQYSLVSGFIRFTPACRVETQRISVLAGAPDGQHREGWSPSDVYTTFARAFDGAMDLADERVREAEWIRAGIARCRSGAGDGENAIDGPACRRRDA